MSEDETDREDGFGGGGLVKELRRELDELRLQIHLGKAEAEDYIEAHKGEFSGLLGRMREEVDRGIGVGAEKAKVIRQKLDGLRVQLALGKMESRDAYEEQKRKIGDAVEELKKEMGPIEEKAGKVWGAMKGRFELGSEALKAKLEVLGLEFGLATAEIGDELKLKKEQLAEEMREISLRLHDAGDVVKGKVDEAGGKISEAFSDVRERLKALFEPGK